MVVARWESCGRSGVIEGAPRRSRSREGHHAPRRFGAGHCQQAVRAWRWLVGHWTVALHRRYRDLPRSRGTRRTGRHRFELALLDGDGEAVLLRADPEAQGEPLPRIGGEFEVGRPAGALAGTPIEWAFVFNFVELPLLPGGRYAWELKIDGRTEDDSASALYYSDTPCPLNWRADPLGPPRVLTFRGPRHLPLRPSDRRRVAPNWRVPRSWLAGKALDLLQMWRWDALCRPLEQCPGGVMGQDDGADVGEALAQVVVLEAFVGGPHVHP